MGKVLLFGAAGQLGRLVVQTKPKTVDLQSFSRDSLDITDHEAVGQVIQEVTPDIIINTAAYTEVDKAQQEQSIAFKVNESAVENIANCAAAETRIVHLSTDFVFSTKNVKPYTTNDTVAPVSIYGESKLAGENALLACHPSNNVIIRTSWLYSSLGKNFVTTMLSLMGYREELQVVNNLYGSPTSAHGFADVLWRIVMEPEAEGIYHWSDRGIITWYDFALEIHTQARQLGILHKDVRINPVPASEFPTPAIRPEYSALDSSKAKSLLGIETVPWQEQLQQVLIRIKRS